MHVPVRCFSCNKVVGHLYDEFSRRHSGNDRCGELLTELGLHRVCCRRIFLTHANTVEEDIVRFSRLDEQMDESRTVFQADARMVRKASCD